jgi:protein-S-isoprenylcysteine O-methyltransferase Ste14
MSDATAEPNAPAEKAGPRSRKRLIQVSLFTALWMGALFGCAGRPDWMRGWIYVVLYFAAIAATGVIVRRFNATLLEARANFLQKGTKSFDKAFYAAYMPLTFIQPAVAGLDAVRFRWSSMPFGLMYPGAVLDVLAIALIAWTLAVNRFAETTVRIQTERGHTVVESGPYRFVRHPMYVGTILTHLAAPLILGSFWALAPGGLIAVLFVWRTAKEDQTLRRELAGYEEFTARTRYRLFPGVW